MTENLKFKIIDEHMEQLPNTLQVKFSVGNDGDLMCEVYTPDDIVGELPWTIFRWNIEKGLRLTKYLDEQYFPIEKDRQLKLWTGE